MKNVCYHKYMLISSKGTSALRVMTKLAKCDDFTAISYLANSLNISRKYLEGIMTTLSKQGIVDVCYGKFGGYRLNKPVNEYNLWEILNAVDENLNCVSCLEKPCKNIENCSIVNTCHDLNALIKDYLKNKTLEDLINDNEQ